MIIAFIKEQAADEKRVAVTPTSVRKIVSLGFQIQIEAGAGDRAQYSNAEFEEAGATIKANFKETIANARVICCCQMPNDERLKAIEAGQLLIGFLNPTKNIEVLQTIATKGIEAIAIEAIPRISKAQKMDGLSSMANIAGCRAVTEATYHFGRFMGGQITAAGKVQPAKVLVIGAGVAGLAAIGAASQMGAIVRAFDTRLEAKEQVESLNAEFLVLDFDNQEGGTSGGYAKSMSQEFIEAEMQLFAKQAKEVDIIITTALIPGKAAPELITEQMVKTMKPGSVIVDLAAEFGGNCRLTEANRVVTKHGVTLIGHTNLPSRLPTQASDMYANNLYHLLFDLNKDGKIELDTESDIFSRATICHSKRVHWPPKPLAVTATPKPSKPKVAQQPEKPETTTQRPTVFKTLLFTTIITLFVLAKGLFIPDQFLTEITIFVLSCFIGYMVIWNVTPALHTPLMSITNAISSVIIIGALLQVSSNIDMVKYIATFAIFIASINIVGGFAVTNRMLAMFKK